MKIHSKEEAIGTAHELFGGRYKGCEFCIAAGSIMRDQGKAMSDLDLVVVYESLSTAYRESFMYDDMPVEAFVHDFESIQFYIDKDFDNAHMAIIDMAASGEVIPYETALSSKLQAYA